jgi:hypothetical protein
MRNPDHLIKLISMTSMTKSWFINGKFQSILYKSELPSRQNIKSQVYHKYTGSIPKLKKKTNT